MTTKASLLFEILNEEIPSRMQVNAAAAFKGAFLDKLTEHGLTCGEAVCHITPRRISLYIREIPVRQEDRTEEKRGPRVGAPAAAVEGFLSSTGMKSLDECEARTTDKGEFWFAKQFIPGRNTAEILPSIINAVIKNFTWPKSMRWASNTLSWVRPIRSILCLFNEERVPGHLDLGSDMVPFSGETYGHRFMSPGELTPTNYFSYRELLEENYVMLDHVDRRAKIKQGIEELAQKLGLRVRPDEDLLDEVTGLVEWPVPLMGNIEPKFMSLPEEVLITSMRVHQRYFALEDQNGKLAPNFILVSNIVPKDDGKAIIQGNERVLRARLSDAQFFFEQDKRRTLEEIGEGLSQLIFQEDLGTFADKSNRMETIAKFLAEHVRVDKEVATRAARLSKCDLMSQMVGEFPELQGIMGYYYSKHSGESDETAGAIADQYKPKGFQDELPRSVAGRIVALSDKIDTLVGFFSIGIKPTGSKDPYALRRNAIGCIRLLESLNGLQLDALIRKVYASYSETFTKTSAEVVSVETLIDDMRAFFFDRLKAYWKEKGVRHDYLDAVFSVAEGDALEVIGKRVEALNAFLTKGDEAGDKLLAAYRRASNIVRIEEKKDKTSYDESVNQNLLSDAAEKELYQILRDSTESIRVDLEKHNFQEPMTILANLRPYIDQFFEQVTVNTDDKNLRENRLRLLSLIRGTLNQVADFSKIEG